MAETARTALITGASAGLGAEFARQLAARGHNLVLAARGLGRMEALAAALSKRHGIEAVALEADLGEREAPRQLHEELARRGVHVDYLINNAGAAGGELLAGEFEEHARFLELMMISVAHMCHLFIPAMRERGWGRVINVSSVAARIPSAGRCNYGPAKAYLVNLSEELHLTLAGDGVHVCALCPGFTHTEFHERAGMMAIKQSTPGFLWYGADTVAREGIRAVEKGKPVQVSGRIYRLADPFFQSVWTRPLLRRKQGL